MATLNLNWNLLEILPHPYNSSIKRVLKCYKDEGVINDINAPQGGWVKANFKVLHYIEDGIKKIYLNELEKDIQLSADGLADDTGIVPMFSVEYEGETIEVTDFQYVMINMEKIPNASIIGAMVAMKNIKDANGLTGIDKKCKYNITEK